MLSFVGVKMILQGLDYKFETWVSLVVIASVLTVSTVASSIAAMSSYLDAYEAAPWTGPSRT